MSKRINNNQPFNRFHGKKQEKTKRTETESRKLYKVKGPESAGLRVLAQFRLEENVHSRNYDCTHSCQW